MEFPGRRSIEKSPITSDYSFGSAHTYQYRWDLAPHLLLEASLPIRKILAIPQKNQFVGIMGPTTVGFSSFFTSRHNGYQNELFLLSDFNNINELSINRKGSHIFISRNLGPGFLYSIFGNAISGHAVPAIENNLTSFRILADEYRETFAGIGYALDNPNQIKVIALGERLGGSWTVSDVITNGRLSPNGSHLILFGEENRLLQINLENGSQRWIGSEFIKYRSGDFSRDGSQFIAGGRPIDKTDRGIAHIFPLDKDGYTAAHPTQFRTAAPIQTMAIHPDGRYFCAGCHYGKKSASKNESSFGAIQVFDCGKPDALNVVEIADEPVCSHFNRFSSIPEFLIGTYNYGGGRLLSFRASII